MSKHTKQNPCKKNSEGVIFSKLQDFCLQLFQKMNIYAGHFQDSTFFKKSFFKEHL